MLKNHLRGWDRKIVRTRGAGCWYEIVYSAYDEEAMKSQQYGCLKMFCTTKTSVGMPMRIVISEVPAPG